MLLYCSVQRKDDVSNLWPTLLTGIFSSSEVFYIVIVIVNGYGLPGKRLFCSIKIFNLIGFLYVLKEGLIWK